MMARPYPLRAILLCRVSTKHAEQETSSERQLARLEAIALDRGWRVVGRISEKHSGAHVLDRPAVAAALDRIIANQADVLVVDHLFRLGRNVKELLQVIDTLAAVGGSFYDATHQIDTSGPIGRMVFTLAAAMGEYEIADRRRKIVEGLDRARARGSKLGQKRVVPLAVAARARALRDVGPDVRVPSWAEVCLLLRAEGLGKYSRGAISSNVWSLERAERGA
jgi:DNA invertase Pin-like site-specific DNA recombinase